MTYHPETPTSSEQDETAMAPRDDSNTQVLAGVADDTEDSHDADPPAQSSVAEPAGSPGTNVDEVERLKDALARSQAEFANYRKRIARDAAATAQRAKASVVETLIPVLDAFDAAASHNNDGTNALRSVLDDAVKRMGMDEIAPEPGELFDPSLHHAVAGPGPSEHLGDQPVLVTEVARPGYRVGDHLLRPAEVLVGSGHDFADQADCDASERR